MDARSAFRENLLDALDSLFDSKATAADVLSLMHTAPDAQRHEPIGQTLDATAASLQCLLQQKLPPATEREQALEVTNELRIALAELLPRPST